MSRRIYFGIRQPSLGGRGRLPFGVGEMSAKPTQGYGPGGHVVVDVGNRYNKSKRENLQTLRIMGKREKNAECKMQNAELGVRDTGKGDPQ